MASDGVFNNVTVGADGTGVLQFTGTGSIVGGYGIVRTGTRLQLQGGASGLVSISDAGNVGIGRTDPPAPLSVDARQPGNQRAVIVLRAVGPSQPEAALGFENVESGAPAFSIQLNPFQGVAPPIALAPTVGNVGIGTAQPGSKLTVDGPQDTAITVLNSDSFRGVRLAANGAAGVGKASLTTTSSAYPLVLGADNSEHVHIVAGGNVGIGTPAPAARLHLAGGATETLIVQGARPGNSANFANLEFRNTQGTTYTGARIGALNDGQNLHGALLFYTNSGGGAGPMERLRIASGGNVGIGTTQPGSKLTVDDPQGTAIEVLNSDGFRGVRLAANGAGTGVASLMTTSSGYALVLGVDNGENVRITAGGNVGIGTTAPGRPLQVGRSDGPSVGIVRLAGNTLGLGSRTWDVGPDPNASPAYSFAITDVSAGAARLVIRADGTGNVGIGTTAPASKLDTVGTIRSTAETVPSAGEGIELMFSGGRGVLQARTRPSGTYRRLDLDGGPLLLNFTSQVGVGIGTDSPIAKLHVAGSPTPNATALRVTGPPSGQGYTMILVGDVRVEGVLDVTGNIATSSGKVYGAVYN